MRMVPYKQAYTRLYRNINNSAAWLSSLLFCSFFQFPIHQFLCQPFCGFVFSRHRISRLSFKSPQSQSFIVKITKLFFSPRLFFAYHTDFIFAIIGEELGFVGCCGVIILLLLIVIECILIGLKAKDTGGRIICGGVASLIGIQSFINVSVATMIFPNTGLSLPFVSYGLTSVVCFFMGIGFVLNVGLQPNKYQ